MKKNRQYPIQKIMFCLAGMMFSVCVFSGCADQTVRFLESEMAQEELVQLTPGGVQDSAEYDFRENSASKSDVEKNNSETKDNTEAGNNHMVRKEEEKQDSDIEEGENEDFKNQVFVYVCGAVANPGVYEVEAGSRVFQAVELAGGLLEDASPEHVNQAMAVTDGQQIYIPSRSEIQDKEDSMYKDDSLLGMNQGVNESGSSGKVNINTADKTELMTIPGVGESRAQDIISYRQEHGGFSSIEEIMNVPGIKEATFEKIKDGIKVK